MKTSCSENRLTSACTGALPSVAPGEAGHWADFRSECCERLLSYTSADKAIASRLASALRAQNIHVWFDEDVIRPGGNIIEQIRQGLQQADALVVILSHSYIESNWVQHELSTWRLTEAAHRRQVIIPVRIDDAPLPLSLLDRVYLDIRDETFEEAVTKLVAALQQHAQLEAEAPAVPPASPLPSESTLLEHLAAQFVEGNLSLFCGAGVSVGAGIPGWDVLLRRLLTNLFRGEGSVDLAAAYQDYFKTSPLIVAQYLKNALGQDYRETLRKALYAGNPASSPLLDAICDLCRPQRAREPLHSIVTFNFDDLLEQNLLASKIPRRAIFCEGQRCERDELPICHVHGYLPRAGDLDNTYDLVFSEDAYHSQFIDPFSWSNLAQLSHLSSQTCLFVGLSMTDPNLRRLLDVSMRKTPDKRKRHYVFRKRYAPADLLACINSDQAAPFVDFTDAGTLVNMAHILEEEDAGNLRLNVIWVDSFDQIPKMLSDIAGHHE